LAGFAVLRCRPHVLIQQNARRDVEAFYAAEAGLVEALTQLPPSASLATALRGPDGVAGTVDDGTLQVRSSSGIPLPSGLQLQLKVETASSGLLRLVSSAMSARGSAKVLEGLIR